MVVKVILGIASPSRWSAGAITARKGPVLVVVQRGSAPTGGAAPAVVVRSLPGTPGPLPVPSTAAPISEVRIVAVVAAPVIVVIVVAIIAPVLTMIPIIIAVPVCCIHVDAVVPSSAIVSVPIVRWRRSVVIVVAAVVMLSIASAVVLGRGHIVRSTHSRRRSRRRTAAAAMAREVGIRTHAITRSVSACQTPVTGKCRGSFWHFLCACGSSRITPCNL
jgi:hypothetical protein